MQNVYDDKNKEFKKLWGCSVDEHVAELLAFIDDLERAKAKGAKGAKGV